MGERSREAIHVEVAQAATSRLDRTSLLSKTRSSLTELKVQPVGPYHRLAQIPPSSVLHGHVDSIEIFDERVEAVPAAHLGLSNGHCLARPVDWDSDQVHIHVFKLDPNGGQMEEIDQEESVHAALSWILPSLDLQGQWEALLFDTDIKTSLLEYVYTAMVLSDRGVDANLVSWNRVVFLHGPPGTGKTSLCKALAQKLTIRLDHRYRYGQLFEINSHSLFSKWFSESGKLVQRMFETIRTIADDPNALVCVMIDEVESLAATRKAGSNEPTDAMRVVNAVLTQIDQIKRLPNVLVLTTSNVTGAIDLAFVDRADIKKYIGPPSTPAIYGILLSSIQELMRVAVLEDQVLVPYANLKSAAASSNQGMAASSEALLQVAQKAKGMSGRILRKLPFLALTKMNLDTDFAPLCGFLQHLDRVVEDELSDRKNLEK
eukprot:snap_masked-scaffold104_size368486-processed-gene-2.27 protein:Tk07558 transcript:snap_masked-scaffold104_size368486-processed-gene-2.27-mRNA-1 annotation:"thyroid receptor-interacting protein 13-like"